MKLQYLLLFALCTSIGHAADAAQNVVTNKTTLLYLAATQAQSEPLAENGSNQPKSSESKRRVDREAKTVAAIEHDAKTSTAEQEQFIRIPTPSLRNLIAYDVLKNLKEHHKGQARWFIEARLSIKYPDLTAEQLRELSHNGLGAAQEKPFRNPLFEHTGLIILPRNYKTLIDKIVAAFFEKHGTVKCEYETIKEISTTMVDTEFPTDFHDKLGYIKDTPFVDEHGRQELTDSADSSLMHQKYESKQYMIEQVINSIRIKLFHRNS